ncbi:site-2 protease family protein [Selenomonas caprae]|uniref:Zn-dependent protease (Includes SpoIVFB) n=2 Tax=Selenomonas TaxID=970 RepID=A0A1I3D690_SELRU|nr:MULTISPECIES: site-2 protease family protein [Selenomonas]TYZ30209.1 site-2 protease family protein [Selenomonas caprae]SFH82098.1 Zn-dependent protease (includes SpoIVFB) [Selenomonas ruminantium]
MFDFNLLQIVAGLPGLIIAMVIHEYAHAQVAVWLGDFTPRMMGRLTLNPKAHIDPLGMLALFLVHFGWAKPVMINPHNFKQPRRDDILVSLAGPGANLLMAFLALVALVLLSRVGVHITEGIYWVFMLIVEYNIGFAIFNLLPLPPLDGSHVLKQLLPRDLAYQFASLERYSFLILILLLMTPVLSMILIPMRGAVLEVFRTLLGILF